MQDISCRTSSSVIENDDPNPDYFTRQSLESLGNALTPLKSNNAALQRATRVFQIKQLQTDVPSLRSLLILRAMMGTGGNIRSVSMRQRSRYFISRVSWKVTGLSLSPKISSSSWMTFSWMSKWQPITDRKKLDAAAVVSWPYEDG